MDGNCYEYKLMKLNVFFTKAANNTHMEL